MHDIVRKPFGVDFIQNNLKFVLHGTNIREAGAKSSHQVMFYSQPQIGNKFTITINNKSFTYTIISEIQADDSVYKIISKNGLIDEDLFRKLKFNYYISNNFNLSAQSLNGQVRVIFSGKKEGVNSFSVSVISGAFTMAILNATPGRERKYYQNYKFLSRFNLEYVKSGNKIEEISPEVLLDADNDGYATLPCNMLAKLTEDIDYPASFTQLYNAFILNHILIKYSLLYCEMYGGEIVNVKESGSFFGINGRNSTSSASVNKPDWNDIFTNTLEKCAFIRLFGCDNQKTYQSHTTGKDYLYVCLFDISKNNAFSKTLKGKVDILYADGSKKTIVLRNLTIKNYSVVRIPVSLNAFTVANREKVIQYTISLWNSDAITNVITRTFNIKAPPCFMHEFLLQNKYGVLEYFFAETKKTESSVKADEIVLDNINDIHITEKSKVFTVKTGIKNYDQLKLIAQAAPNKHNFILLKNRLIPIFIVPESITILDESKDLQETSFKFRFKDDDTEEIVVQNSRLIDTNKNPFDNVWNDNQLDTTEPTSWDDRDKFNESNTPNIWNE